MKLLKRLYNVCALILVLTFVVPTILPLHNEVKVSAATIKLSEKELTLTVGDSKTLKVTGTKTKVTWSSSKKSVATVSKTGKVTGVKAGKALITATVGKKNLVCKIIVNDPVRPEVLNAPFEAQETTHGDFKYIIPKEWKETILTEEGNNIIFAIAPSSANIGNDSSFVSAIVSETGLPKVDYATFKEQMSKVLTEDTLQAQLKQSGYEVEISDFVISDYESELGTAIKVEYKAVINGSNPVTQTLYELMIDNYMIVISINNAGDSTTPDVSVVGEYLLNTILIAE